mmetsp:Transcript_40838/g.108243  ORF Transcript_40838/g.108243 Transcript_40838/m.108243 type:complete len:210 (+) Transcript_40838:208-837(+)
MCRSLREATPFSGTTSAHRNSQLLNTVPICGGTLTKASLRLWKTLLAKNPPCETTAMARSLLLRSSFTAKAARWSAATKDSRSSVHNASSSVARFEKSTDGKSARRARRVRLRSHGKRPQRSRHNSLAKMGIPEPPKAATAVAVVRLSGEVITTSGGGESLDRVPRSAIASSNPRGVKRASWNLLAYLRRTSSPDSSTTSKASLCSANP